MKPCSLLAIFLSGQLACQRSVEKTPLMPPGDANIVAIAHEQMARMGLALERVAQQNVDDTILTSGKVVFDDQRVLHVFSPVSGKVARVFVQLGDTVKEGDILVTIDSPDIGVATSDVGKARADLIAAEHDYQRQRDLLALHATAQREFETAADNYRRARAEMERAAAKARLFRQGDVTGQRYTLRSDIAGEVFVKAVSPGMEISGQYGGGAQLELFTLGEADKVWVLADVFEMDVPRVHTGAKVVVSVASYPNRAFTGVVDWVSAALDPATHATRVRCKFDNPDRALKPEMFATARISVDVRQALAVPRRAVVRLGDHTFVFVHRAAGAHGEERFERVPIDVDEGESGDWLPVSHGLNEGDEIVVSGALLLSGVAP